jgi:pyruvate kinase
VETTDALFRACRAAALAEGLARPGDRIVVTAGVPLDEPGSTNLLKVLVV